MVVMRKGFIYWTETACLQLVEAVMKVEEEIMNDLTIRPPSSRETTRKLSRISSATGKWSRIAKLLPRELQGQTGSRHKCSRKFFDLLRIRKDKLAGKNTQRSRREMTKPVWEILKRREELLKVLCSKRSSTCPSELETSVQAFIFENYVEEDPEKNDISELNLMQNASGGTSTPSASRSFRQDSENRNHTALSNPEPYSRPTSEPRDPGTFVKLSTRVGGIQTRARIQAKGKDSYSCTRRSSSYSRGSRSKRKASPSLRQTDSREIWNASMDCLMRRLDLDFSRLCSWVQDRFIPVGKEVIHEMITSGTTSAIRSCLRHRESDAHRRAKDRATEAFEMHTCLSKKIDYQIEAASQQLRMNLAEVLKKTSMELAEEVLQEQELLYTSAIQFMGQGKRSLQSKKYRRYH